ncbi:BREX-1 system adenine-specific DNA-methyltransferase PglX [Pseudomonas sp. 25571]|jgi:hypothetical protein|uniref:BREX-1 system adenine-specific DNA-methyltransferase PglX n=1 Tax=Pseudomonas sp. 25571 TaxID=2967216 RepID=UPI0023641D8B|nr:BREX-1 system adenine-specific DNA-methyltransferase PglX [Pseudomonas sp. 25571]MDD2062071.1 BREX-1 system adenine-specific DNA-methyltransferase PglX [Pseudomonas sp. 25571]
MNTNNIKNYAPKARTAFIAAMTKRAELFGIRESSIPAMCIASLEQKGDLALIGDRAFPASIIPPRTALVKKVKQLGFAQAMEQAAYSWFNRLCAIRYMELKDYLAHGRRVLSAADGSATTPQILDDCLDIDLPGLDKQHITELKLDGNKDEELYRELLLAQCHALHQAMPFLFEAVDDATELLLPDNLTKTDSLIRELVSAIPEEDWANIEIIGWLYQFYISEKKDQVIGKVVKSEDIPAATQLFTPNWIVKYMVQNSLGAQWLATYPSSPLKAQMEYYIEPDEQTDEVKVQLAAITPESLNPEELTLIDPASGSGHILVEAYDLFKLIYLERGHRQRDVAQLILEKNLFGLDIDGRAAQMTGFALMMKGRADDRRLFERGVKLNVMALVDSADLDADALAYGVKLADYGLQLGDITELKRLFEHATTFGSLIQVPERLAKKLPELNRLCKSTSQDLFVAAEIKVLGQLVRQAELLAAKYDAVVANPPYVGSKYLSAVLKDYIESCFSDYKSDLFAACVVRFGLFSSPRGRVGLMTPFTWMFLSSYENLRRHVLNHRTLQTLVRPEYHAIWSSAAVPICAYVYQSSHVAGYSGGFIDMSAFYGEKLQPVKLLEAIRNKACGWYYSLPPDEFSAIPGAPLAFWVSSAIRHVYASLPALSSTADARQGIKTGDNERFLRFWHEVSLSSTVLPGSSPVVKKWFPCSKGGDYRKWFGNCEYTVNWENDGHQIRNFYAPGGRLRSRPQNVGYFFREGATWSTLTSSHLSVRLFPEGFAFESKGSVCFPHDAISTIDLLGCLNSNVVGRLIAATSATLDYSEGAISRLPWKQVEASRPHVSDLVSRAQADWNAYERSWDFNSLPFLTTFPDPPATTIESSYDAWIAQNHGATVEMQRLEEENNRLFIDAYGLAGELTPNVPIEQITLTVNPAYRYGGKLSEAEQWTRFREDSMQELVSYAIGCMLGRYSLDEPGLIYAHSGNQGFDPRHYASFPADTDGILPLTDKEWFADDATNRLIEFISVAWNNAHLETNLRFLAGNLSQKKTESSRDTLRRYLCDNFFKDHLQTYKKRPIYWLFSSGKQKAFQCLIYLHRYNEGTLARMRTEYVIPLTAKLSTYAIKLDQDIEASTSTAEKKRLEKELVALHNQQAELATFDEKLRHYADQRINLDLDEGVKENYGKFGDLLAEVKAVTGDKAE